MRVHAHANDSMAVRAARSGRVRNAIVCHACGIRLRAQSNRGPLAGNFWRAICPFLTSLTFGYDFFEAAMVLNVA